MTALGPYPVVDRQVVLGRRRVDAEVEEWDAVPRLKLVRIKLFHVRGPENEPGLAIARQALREQSHLLRAEILDYHRKPTGPEVTPRIDDLPGRKQGGRG